jgi:hypothetical protein
MKPTRKLSRRSFLGSFSGAAAAAGALLAIAGRASASQITDSDTGPRADPVGRGRRGGVLIEAGDSDFANPLYLGDTVRSDPPPGMQTGIMDRDSGPAADVPGYGVGARREVRRGVRCTAMRRRIAGLENMGPAARDGQIETLRAYLDRWGCD